MEKDYTSFEELESDIAELPYPKSFLDEQLEAVREKEFMKNAYYPLTPEEAYGDGPTRSRRHDRVLRPVYMTEKIQLLIDMSQRMFEMHTTHGFDPYKTVYGIRFDYEKGLGDKELYVNGHSNINPFVFGIAFNHRSQAESLLEEFKERIEMYYM